MTIFAVEDYGPRGDRMSTRGWCIRMQSSMSGMEILEASFRTSHPNVKVPGAASYAFAVINQSLSLEQRPFAWGSFGARSVGQGGKETDHLLSFESWRLVPPTQNLIFDRANKKSSQSRTAKVLIYQRPCYIFSPCGPCYIFSACGPCSCVACHLDHHIFEPWSVDRFAYLIVWNTIKLFYKIEVEHVVWKTIKKHQN